MLKQIFISSFLILTTFVSVNAQKTGWGATASLIYASNGDLIEETSGIIDNKGEGGVGFNLGLYGNLNLGLVYIRPKLVYSQSSNSYQVDADSDSDNHKLKTFDLPILVGIKIIKPISFVLGPSFRYIIDSDLEGLSFDSIENEFTVGANIGLALVLGRITVDLIYERSFNENEASFINDNTGNTYTLDTRPQQLLVGISYRFSSKKN